MYHALMVPLDGSAFGEHALPLALGIARQACARVELTYVHEPPSRSSLAPDAPGSADTAEAANRVRIQQYLTQLAQALSERWDVQITTATLDGPVADTLYAHALASSVDLVVMTTHGRSPLSQAWLGSVATALVRRLPIPLLLVRPHEEALDLLETVHTQVFEHVLLPLDGSPMAEEILLPAVQLGTLMQAEYTLVQAIEPPLFGYAPAPMAPGINEQVLAELQATAHRYLDEVAERLRAQQLQVQTQVLVAPVAAAILEYAREQAIDLIALTTHGRGGVARVLLGSVADTIVRNAGAPVLVLRPQSNAPMP